MSRSAHNLPLREKHSRMAKAKASVKIAKYFKPEKIMPTIPENSKVIFKKDANNNYVKRPLPPQKLQPKKRPDEKESVNGVKRMKAFQSKSVRNGNQKNDVSTQKTSNDSASPITSADSIIIVLDSSIDSNNSMVVDSTTSTVQTQTEHGFDALHTDDSTDDGENDSMQPYWSLYNNRVAIVIDQSDIHANIVDSFFGSKAEQVQSHEIFPNTKPIHRRRSTAIWNTPPRYSTLPKY